MKIRKRNIRLYPIYKMFSWDLLFFYAIAYVFLVQTKGFSPAEIILMDASYPIAKIFFNIPCMDFVEKKGKRKSLIIANSALSLSILILIFSVNVWMVILSYTIMSFSFLIKGMTESNFLFDSVVKKSESEKSKNLFSKIEEIGARNYYFLDGISSFATGFLYIVNDYLPMIICLVFTVLATSLSTCFKEVNKKETETSDNINIKDKFIEYGKELKEVFAWIIKSRRLKAIIVYIFAFEGILYVSDTLRESLLNDLGIPPQYFSAIISSLIIVSAFFTSLQAKIHKKFKNKALTVVTRVYIPTFIFIGIISVLNINWYLKIAIIIMFYAIQYAIDPIYATLISRYTKNFTNEEMRVKISSAISFVTSISQAVCALLASFCLDYFTVSKTFILFGIAYLIIMTLILIWMKPRFGLKPKEYTEEDILTTNKK